MEDGIRKIINSITPDAGIIMGDGGPSHPEWIPSFSKHPKDHIAGTVKGKKVSKLSFECHETGWQVRVATVPKPDDTSLFVRITREPNKDDKHDEINENGVAAYVTIPGVKWTVYGAYLLAVEKWELKEEYTGKAGVAGKATGWLSWVPMGDNGIKVDPVGGRFVDAPIRYTTTCNIPKSK